VTQVAEHVIAGVEEWNNKKPPMPMLIYFNADDLRKQAEDSTRRFEQGLPQLCYSCSPLLVIMDQFIQILFSFKFNGFL
jgi:hypothetical protein